MQKVTLELLWQLLKVRQESDAASIKKDLERHIQNFDLELKSLLLKISSEIFEQRFQKSPIITQDDQEVIGESLDLKNCFERIALVANTDIPVLLLGETGSGKEVISKSLHLKSERRKENFIRVNCGAIPHDLIDSELFGHEKGSFTGAIAQHQGFFEKANGGTLFLDEMGELTLAAQVRLLRILQDGIVQRVGSKKEIPVNVRVIMATHQNIPLMIEQGKFRQDLWFRISSFPIEIPALRHRPNDLPLLANYFSKRASKKFGFPPVNLSREQHDFLLNYSWPGNVRELISVIERAVLLGQGVSLELEKSLGINYHHKKTAETQGSPLEEKANDPLLTKVASFEDSLKTIIIQALNTTHGRVSGPFGAAKLLKMNANTLRSKMRKLKIT